MWQTTIESLNNRTTRYRLADKDAYLKYSDVLSLWRDDKAFCTFFAVLLADAPFEAYRWETPPVTTGTADRDFEFVLVESNNLVRRVDSNAFAEHFVETADVVTFANLSGDAVMVVPRPISATSSYGHLASFVRDAPVEQVQGLWLSVGQAMQRRLGDRPVWLSTAGLGVSWLHVRLDSRPKYYFHTPYRSFEA